MNKSIAHQLSGLALGEAALLCGVRVVRRSLLGFEVGGAILDAAEATARLARPAKGRVARIEVCFRCGGDGLGRRDRGECGVCHGRGITGAEPASGWASAPPAEAAAALDQALKALSSTTRPRAREALAEVVAALGPVVPRAYGDLRRGGVTGPRGGGSRSAPPAPAGAGDRKEVI